MRQPFPRTAWPFKILRRLEPWYDWGTINTVNMDARTGAEQVEGDVYRFELQWLGLHLGFQIGRTPKRGR
jgi:hypothetical protein